MQTPAPPDAPLKAPFNVDRLGSLPSNVPIRTDAAMCAALAEYFEILAVEECHALLAVRRWRKHGAIVEGVITARIIQQCVVTLEPVPVHVHEEIRVRFLPASMLRDGERGADEIIIDPMADDPPEIFEGRIIDLGALVLEHLALGIDPYPRAAGAVVPEKFTSEDAEPEVRPNPFQILARLRDKPDG